MSLEGKTAEEIAQLAELAQSLADNPKTRMGFLHLTKAANPSVAIPEIDIPHQMNQALNKGLERLQKVENENAQMKLERDIMAKREGLLANTKLGVTKADLPEIEKLMMEKKIPDHETAAEFYQMQKKSAVPTPSNALAGQRTNSMPSMDLKPFSGNINDWARNQAAKAIDELKAGQIKLA